MNNDKKNNLNISTKVPTANSANNNKSASLTKTATTTVSVEEATINQQKLQLQQQKTATTAKHTQKSAAAARSNKQAAKAQKQNSNLGKNNNNTNQSAALNLSAAAALVAKATTNVEETATTTTANTELRATTPPSASGSNNNISGAGKRTADVSNATAPLTTTAEAGAVEQPVNIDMTADPSPSSATSGTRKARIRVATAIVSNNNTNNNNALATTPASTAAAETAPSVNSNKLPKNAKQTTASTAPAKGIESTFSKKTSTAQEPEPLSSTCSSSAERIPVSIPPPPLPLTAGAVVSTDTIATTAKEIANTKTSAVAASTTTTNNKPAPTTKSSKESQFKLSALPLLMGSAAAAAAAAAAGNSSSKDSNKTLIPPTSSQTQSALAAAAALKQKLKNAAAASSAGALNSARSSNSSTSSNSSSSLTSSVGIVNAISSALQTIITSDTSDTDTEVFPRRVTDLSESDEESVSEILLACLCLRPDLLDDIPESEPESCGHEEADEANDDEDDGDDEDEDEDMDDEDEDDDEDEEHEEEDEDEDEDEEEIDEDEDEDEEIQDPNEVTGNFLLDTNIDRSRNLSALFEAAANEKAPVLRHATHAIDETKQALTKMRCANSPRDKTIFSRMLIAACNDNDVNTVRRLLGKGNVNINESTDDGESLLSMACSAGYYELAQVLLAMSAAQVEDKGQKDCTPLMEAASAGHSEIVKLLLSHNADVNAHCATGNTPLMFACAGGHVEVVRELLKAGANVEEQNENGHTPLMEAASAGHVEVAKVLLEHGAGINTHSNEFKESALTLACYKGHLNMVRFLLQAGADQEHKTDEMHTALMEASMDGHVEVARLLLDSGAQVNMPTDSFESPLTLAACGGHVELATLLIERGANIEEVNDEGYTPLMEAAREGHEEMVALLLSKGANINATTEETQETALTLACCGGFSEVAEFLIKEGANLELGASTPLMEAAQEGHTDLVRFLLENKANVHAETQTGDTALTHACENGHTDAAEVLLTYGAELEHESEGARTPLMKACRAGHLCTVKFLILKGADVNRQTSNNDHTPLSLACAGGHQAVVEWLLKNGADPFHKLKDNSTMLIEAAKGGHTRVVELLFKYPHFIQNHQNELQSAAAAAATAATTTNAAAATVGINNGLTDQGAAAAANNQMRLINMQHQKQLQQQQKQLQQTLQQQLQNLSAPPGLHEVSDAARATNQQMFHQQQFTAGGAVASSSNVSTTSTEPLSVNQQTQQVVSGGVGEYLNEQLQLAAAAANAAAAKSGEEYAAIDINSLSAQQQEALIAKSRLFHLQAGFEQGITQQQQQQQLMQHQHPDVLDPAMSNLQPILLDMVQINSLTPPQKPPPAPPSLQQQQQDVACNTMQPQLQAQHQQKVKGSLRKNRQQQPPAPFELNLPAVAPTTNLMTTSQLIEHEARKRAVGDDGASFPTSGCGVSGAENDDSSQSGDLMEEFSKNFESYCNLALSNQAIGQVSTNEGTSLDEQQQQLKIDGQLQANNTNNAQFVTGQNNNVARLANRANKNVQQQQQKSAGAIAVAGNAAERNTQIITPSDVSQSTAISDRPKAKAVSKKDGKNFRKTTTFTQLPILQQHHMVSIYNNNNMPVLLSNNDSKQPADQNQPMFNPMMYMQQHQQQLQLTSTALDVGGSGVSNSASAGVAGVTDYSNSPASPLASPPNANSPASTIFPSPAYIIQQQQQQHAIILSEILQQQQQLAASNALAAAGGAIQISQAGDCSNDILNAQGSGIHENAQDANVGGDDSACCQGQTMALVEDNRSLPPADGELSAVDDQHLDFPGAAAFGSMCGMYKIAEHEYLKKVDMKILQDGWQFFGVRRFFDEQMPKSPTDTPPEKQLLEVHYATALEQASVADTKTPADAKNLSTLCSVAAAAAVEAANASAADASEIQQQDMHDSNEYENQALNVENADDEENVRASGAELTGEGEKNKKNDGANESLDKTKIKTDAQPKKENENVNEEIGTIAKAAATDEAGDSSDSEERDFDIFDDKSDDSDQQQHQTYEDIDLPPNQHQHDDLDESNAQYSDTGCGDAPITDQKLSNRLDNSTTTTSRPKGPFRMVDFAQMVNDFNRDMNTLEDMNYMYPHLSQYLKQTTLAGADGGEGQQDDKESDQVMALTEQFYLNQQNLEDTFGAAVSDNGSASSGEASVGGGGAGSELYSVLDEPIEQYEEIEREPMYDLAVDHLDEIFQVIHNVNDPALQELNCSELADFGLNSLCKTRWNGNWAQAPKWSSQEQLLAAHQQALLSGDDHHINQQHPQQQQQQPQQQSDHTHQDQVNIRDRVCDFQAQRDVHMHQSIDTSNQLIAKPPVPSLKQRKQRTALSLLPYVSEGSETAMAIQQMLQQQTHPLSASFQYHLQQQQQQLQQQVTPSTLQSQQLNPLSAAGNDPAAIKQHIQRLQLHHQKKALLLKEMAGTACGTVQQMPQNNTFVFFDGNANDSSSSILSTDEAAATAAINIDGADKVQPQELQLMFEMPQNAGTVQQPQQQQEAQQQLQDQDEAQQLQNLQLLNQELLDQRKHHQERMKLLQQQQQQILHDLSQETAKRLLQQQQQTQQLEQIALLQQKKAAVLSHQVLNQQVLKQKQLQQHQQLLIHQQQQQQQQQHQACSQHTQQVQVATQTQSTVVVPHPNVVSRGTAVPQFCPQMPLPNDISNGLGVCAVANAQQQQQHQQQQQQQSHQLQLPNVSVAQQLPAPSLTPTTATTTTTTKTPSGIAKKAIDKQARKDRNRYSLLRQSPAGGQVNAAAQQHYQQAVAASTTTVDKTIDVDSETDSNHDTALTLACAGGHEELVELLITRGANIEHRDKKGFTPLILAATAGHEKVVDILLKRGAQLEAQSERTKDTPLSLACSGGRYEVVELLLNVGANKEHRNVSDYTPLSLAASGGYVNIIKLLLSHGAEINSRTGSKLGISPLMLAAMNGHTAAVKLLLDQGSDINAQIETNRNTALTLACFQGRHEVVSLLLDRKANVEHRAKTGLTPLMEAASGGYIEVGRVLLDKGADVNAAPVPTSRDTALTIAADKGHLKFVELLLSRNAIVEVKNKKGNSPLWLAAHGGHLSVVEVLYGHNADIDSQDNRRVSCLMAAFRKGHTKVVKWMVQYVTQFPSDQEMTRFVSTISDKELSEKCYECMKIIHAAKVAQEVKAFQNARSLLDELDMERSREESRRAAAARRRERKKKKKLEKKEEKRRQMEGTDGAANDENDAEDYDKDSDRDMDSDKEENVGAADDNAQGDSGIDRSSCSSADVKAAVAVQHAAEKGANKNKNKKKKGTQQQQPPAPKSHSPEHEEVNISTSKLGKQTKQTSVEQQPVKSATINKKQQVSGAEAKQQQSTASANTTQKKTALVPEALNNHNKQREDISTNAATASKKKDTGNSANKQREKENYAPKAADQNSAAPAGNAGNAAANKQQQIDKQKSDKVHETNVCSRKINIAVNESKAHHGGDPTTANYYQHMPSVRSEHHHQQQHGTVSTKNTPPKRGEDGWKEVVRKSSTQQSSSSSATSSTTLSSSSNNTAATAAAAGTTSSALAASTEVTVTKKVQVPVNAISRVIGRAGSNINAIRATTGAHIEVEKQGKNQSERSITIKGLTEATKQAHMLILALIKDPEVDILQMLPRINASSSNPKPSTAATLPMTVGTWDNKTATQPASSSSTSSTSSASSTPATMNTSNATAANSVSSSMTFKSSSFGGSNSVASSKYTSNQNANSMLKTHSIGIGSSGSAGSKSMSNSNRSQTAKPYYAQQQPHQSSRASSNGTVSQQKQPHKLHHSQDVAKHAPSNSYVGALTSSQKKPHQAASAGQTSFAAKLTSSSSTASHHGSHYHGSPTKKGEGGRLGANTAMPYGRGKPIASMMSANNSLNTFSGPIGTFNVAEVAAINAAAAAAQAAAAATAANAASANAAANTNAASTTVTRSVTPIGPPNKRNLVSPSISTSKQQQQTAPSLNLQQQHQSLSNVNKVQKMPVLGDEVTMTSASDLEAAAIKASAAAAAAAASNAGFSAAQLASKISSGYSLFDDSYQSQWCDNSQIYKPATCDLVGDLPPKADASKAPGYNRNILSSPVGGSSKASSSQSTSPPGVGTMQAPIGSQVNSQQQPQQTTNGSNVGNTGLSALTVNTSIGAPTARSPGQVANADGTKTNVGINGNNSQPTTPSSVGISPGVIKPPAPIGQPTTSSANSTTAATSSGLTIQRPHSSQLRGSNGPNTSNTGACGSANVNQLDRQTPTMGFGPIGMNAGRSNGPGAIGETPASMNRFYDHAATSANVPHQFHMEPSAVGGGMHPPYVSNSSNSTGTAVHPLASRLNPRASAFSQNNSNSNNKQPPQAAIGSGMYGAHQQNPGSNSFKGYGGGGPSSGIAPGRPQSQPQQGNTLSGGSGSNMQTVPPNQHRWYGGSEYGGGYVQPGVRDMLALENGVVVNIGGTANSGNSPAAMSPNQGGVDDSRKMPRPIGTERATWKFGNYPNLNMNAASSGGMGLEDPLAAAMSTAGAMAKMGGMQPFQTWMMDKSSAAAAAVAAAAAQQQAQQQQPNWIKQQQAAAASSAYRYYGNAAAAAGALSGISMADYHHSQDAQFHQMTLDYHATMPPPSLNQSQPLNLVPNYPYPHFVGSVNDAMAPGMHMPDKMELWGGEHHDKHTWPSSNWTN